MKLYILGLFILGFCIKAQAGITVVVHSGSAALFDASGKLKSSSNLKQGMAFELPKSFRLRSNLSSDLAFWMQSQSPDIKTIPGKGTFARIIVNGKEEWVDTNQFYQLALSQQTVASTNSKTEADTSCNSVDCLLKKSQPQVLQAAAAKSTQHTKEVVAKVAPKKMLPSLEYTFEDCYSFISRDGSYGDYGTWAKEEFLRYRHIFASADGVKILKNGGCANYPQLSEDEKIHFLIAVVQDLSATESRCGHYYTSSDSVKNSSGTAAIGLLQLDNDTVRDKSVRGHPKLIDQQNIRTANTTGVDDTCRSMSWPSGYSQKAMTLERGARPLNSMHNPRANIRCGIGMLMRMMAEGKHPIAGGYFGPWNVNKRDPNLPFKSARAIFSKHPLCHGEKR